MRRRINNFTDSTREEGRAGAADPFSRESFRNTVRNTAIRDGSFGLTELLVVRNV